MSDTDGVIVVETDETGVRPEAEHAHAEAGRAGPAPTASMPGMSMPAMAAAKARSIIGWIRARLLLTVTGEAGMSTVEYAIGTIAAAAFGAVLYQVVTGDNIVSALTGIIDDALNPSV